jgi:bifunctional non-homologous end joining protein LigD
LPYRKQAKQEYVQRRRQKAYPYPYSRPRRIKPMLAGRGSEEDIDRHSFYEQRKLDGTRAIIIKDGNRVVMRGRSWINDYASQFPEIVEEVRKLPVESCVLDSELTFFKKGTDKDVFLTALACPETKKPYTAKAMVFDVLYVEDYDVKNLPFTDRQEVLLDLVPDELKHVDVVKTVTKGKKAYLEKLKKMGGEGVILKERKSPYREGERTSEWLKVKHWKSDEAVVVGYTHGKGARAKTFGSLILAQKGKDGKWRYIGKTSGFSDQEMTQLLQKMRKLETSKPPAEVPSDVDAKAWVKPKIVVEVKYYERTPDGILRFPDYMRERHDKTPSECATFLS